MDMSDYVGGGGFLRVDNVRAGPMREVIAEVVEGNYGKPNIIFQSGNRMSLNVTNGRTLAKHFGVESDDWIGKEVELAIGKVEYQGSTVDSIVIKPISPALPPAEQQTPKPKPPFDDEIPF